MRATTFIDDSGSGASLFDLNGNAIPQTGSQPLIVVYGLIVCNPVLERFNREWDNLRLQIQAETKSVHLPTVHMRLMFGEDTQIPSQSGGQPNPYLNVTRERRLQFIESALEIIDSYVKQGSIFSSFFCYRKEQYIADVEPYYQSDIFKNEYGYLRKKSLKATKKLHTLICNPHIFCLAALIINLERQAKRYRFSSIDVVYDRNPLSKGFDVDYTLRMMRNRGRLNRIGRVSESSETETSTLQAADVRCNLEYKAQVKAEGAIIGSPIVDEWREKYVIPGLPVSQVSKDVFTQILTVHYAVARHGVEVAHPDFADAHLVSVEEFRIRAATAITGSGVSVLK